MRFEVEHVTPEVAARWLAKPWARQRTISDHVVGKYAVAMGEGRWEEPSLDPVGFTPDGELGNGQHRLQAVIRSGWEGDMLVAYDVPPENFVVMDTGRKRQAGQFIKLPQGHLIASIARLVLWYDHVRPLPLGGGRSTGFDNDVVLAFVDANEDMLAASASDADTCYRHSSIPGSIHGAVLFIARRDGVDPDRLHDWVEGVTYGANMSVGDARMALREYFIRHPNVKANRHETWAAVARAFNAFIHGRSLSKVQQPREGEEPPIIQTVAPGQKQTNAVKARRSQIGGKAASADGRLHGAAKAKVEASKGLVYEPPVPKVAALNKAAH